MASKTSSSVKVAPLADRVVVKALEETESMRGGWHFSAGDSTGRSAVGAFSPRGTRRAKMHQPGGRTAACPPARSLALRAASPVVLSEVQRRITSAASACASRAA